MQTGTTNQATPVQLNSAAPIPEHHAVRPHRYSTRKSNDFEGIDAPPGPTGTDLPQLDNSPHTSPFQDIPLGRFPGQSPYASTAALGGVDTGGPREAYERENVHGRDGLRTERVRRGSRGSDDLERQRTPSSERRAQNPGGGPLGGERLPRTGTEKHPSPSAHYVKSTGLAADGGNFDAAKPGAGREAERLMDITGIPHGADLKPGAQQSHPTSQRHEPVHKEVHQGVPTTHQEAHQGVPAAQPDAAAHAENERHQASLAAKIKEKLRIGH